MLGLLSNEFDARIIEVEGHPLHALELSTIQINIGLRCNLTCKHCHVGAGPGRKEEMDWATMEQVLAVARQTGCHLIDITGGAPEMNPHFRRLIHTLAEADIPAQVRTNLTVLLETGFEDMAEFMASHRVRLTASLPCYLEENVDQQRGDGVFQDSISALSRLNSFGYGIQNDLPLMLVYNPLGTTLPPPQVPLETMYRKELRARFGVEFTSLITITNMPVGRFWSTLRKEKKADDYMAQLRESFNPNTLSSLMCRHLISVDWNGRIHDCDFNLAMKMPVDHGAPTHIRDFDPSLARRRIVTGAHCFGCTAGAGSSCGGALT